MRKNARKKSKSDDFGTPRIYSIIFQKVCKNTQKSSLPSQIMWRFKYVSFPAIGTKKHEKSYQKKRTFDAPKNQYVFDDFQNYFFDSQKKLQKMYGFLLVIEDSENGSAAVGVTKSAKEIPP